MWVPDSRDWIPDAFSLESGFQFPIVGGISDSFTWILDSEARDSRFLEQKFPAFRNQDYLTSVGRGVILIICIKRSSLFIYPIQADERILNILTYVGLTLSLIGITSTIICYAFLTYVLIFKIPVKSVHLLYFVDSSVHFHIC